MTTEHPLCISSATPPPADQDTLMRLLTPWPSYGHEDGSRKLSAGPSSTEAAVTVAQLALGTLFLGYRHCWSWLGLHTK